MKSKYIAFKSDYERSLKELDSDRAKQKLFLENKNISKKYNFHKKRTKEQYFDFNTQSYKDYAPSSRFFSKGYVACIDENPEDLLTLRNEVKSEPDMEQALIEFMDYMKNLK